MLGLPFPSNPENRETFVVCRVCRSRLPSNSNAVTGVPTEKLDGITWYVVTCRQCAEGMAKDAFEELLAAVADAERDWRLDDFLELRARREGW